MSAPYTDRTDAGNRLASELLALKFTMPPLVLAIPNGGVAVAIPIIKALEAELDLIIVRKLQIPHNPEAGFGALTSLGSVMLNQPLVAQIGLSQPQIDEVIRRTEQQIQRRQETYTHIVRNTTPKERLVILVDDGLASGYTMLAAIASVRTFNPKQIIVAVPTGSPSAVKKVYPMVDKLICPHTPSGFIFAVADAYQHWYDVPDEEVLNLLETI
ncbi:MAG: phosphoribosyltransferase family protein [Candidatus Hermodarchaeota archaeon]|nr:phosphoribosyltransferase family protein [Candidatus Hermodarchaeota archaeon]